MFTSHISRVTQKRALDQNVHLSFFRNENYLRLNCELLSTKAVTLNFQMES